MFTSRWIWTASGLEQSNYHLLARKVCEVSSVPASATCRITAGSVYQLWINGQLVGQGPNPADPSFYYFDEYEVAACLKPGRNVVAVVGYNYGPKSHGIINQNRGPAGLICEIADGSGRKLVGTDKSWRVIKAPQWDQTTTVNSTLAGDFKETQDTRQEPVGWNAEAGFDDSKWETPAEIPCPFPVLNRREIPHLTGPRMYPAAVFWESASVTYAWRDDWEIYHEQNLVPGNPLASPNRTAMEVRKTHDDFAPSALFDFGKNTTGYVEIGIRDSQGGVIDVLYGEDLHLTRVDRFVLRGGAQVLRPLGRRTFRYLKLLFPEARERITVERVSLDVAVYPVKYDAGTFACSDPLLNRCYDVSKWTIQMSMLDHFVDCPWREKSIYGGDIYNETLFALYAFGDQGMARKTLRQMFAIQFPQGALPVVGPYSGFDSFYPAWTAFPALALLDLYRVGGNLEVVKEFWPKFTKLMDWVIGELNRSEIHLIGEPPEHGGIDKWMQGDRVKYLAWSNFPFYLLLRRAAEMALVLHDPAAPARAGKYDAAADAMRESIRAYLIDENGLFAVWPRQGTSSHSGSYDNGYLAWSGVLDPEAATRVARKLAAGELPASGGPFADLFITDAIFQQGLGLEALNYIRRNWGDIVNRGATTMYEHHDPSLPMPMRTSRGLSQCHGWSAGPVYLLPAYVLGIRPLEAGFAKVLIAPQRGDLQWAEGRVPTPKGDVVVNWSRTSQDLLLNVELPEGVPGIVEVPDNLQHVRIVLDGKPAVGRRFEVGPGRHRIVCAPTMG